MELPSATMIRRGFFYSLCLNKSVTILGLLQKRLSFRFIFIQVLL